MGGVSKKGLLREYKELMALEQQESVGQRLLQQRGRQLEDLLYRLLQLEGLRPRRAVRPGGEEIDLCFTHGHRHFLLEARWRKRVVAADIFAFRGKLEGKLAGTLGIFLNVGSRLSKEAMQAITWGKQLNCLIFDGGDLWHALQPRGSFKQVLDMKLELAASEGAIYFAYKALPDEEVTST
jgi:hypothetical protein